MAVPDCVYCGGRGVVIRNHFDGYETDEMKTVLPATFWVNDMMQPSQIYPNVGVKPDGAGGWIQETPEDAAMRASVAYVVGTKLGSLLPWVDNIQDEDWGWGVFYATDSNAVDARCRWLGDVGFYDCPGGAIDQNDLDTILWDDTHSGSGWYSFGNPHAQSAEFSGGGGGTGNHFNFNSMDQEQARNPNGVGLLYDWDAQCNYDLNGNNWGDWIEHWFANGDMSKYVDAVICWVNNPRDLIKMSNTIYSYAAWGTGDGFPKPGTQAAYNWGWNEIPLDRLTLNDPNNWDAVLIHLPAEICGAGGNEDKAECLDDDSKWNLETTLDTWVNAGLLVPGYDNIGNRPGSYVVFVKEFSTDDVNWFRWFFCRYWKSPNNYEIMSYADGDNDGACYIEWASTTVMNAPISTQNSKVTMV